MRSEHLLPDGMLGALFAIEGVQGAVTILNGPTGCKYYPASLSDSMIRREISFNPLRHVSEFYFGQSRLPCTYMDTNDYVMGAEEKLKRIFAAAEAESPELIGVVNSPGASLIGERLPVHSDKIPVVRLESPGYSESVGEGYQRGNLALLEALDLSPVETQKKRVNLVGLSIWHLGWQDSLSDLSSLLSLCGIEVGAAIGLGWSVDQIRESAGSALNVVVDADFSDGICRWYEEELEVPSFSIGRSPLGFAALEEWVDGICSRLNADSSPAREKILEARRLAYREIHRLNTASGLPRGRSFSLMANSSLALPLLEVLHTYLGMTPNVLQPVFGDSALLRDYLRSHGLEGLLGEIAEAEADLVLADGNTVASMMARDLSDNGIDVMHPGLRSVQLRPEPLLGLGGTMRLLDMTLNSLAR